MKECEILPNSVVNSEGYLIHFSVLDDENPISHLEVMERKVWKKATREELRSIEKNKTWELVLLPKKKKNISVR